MFQLPPASHCANASQMAPLVTGGTSVPGLAPTRSTESRAGVTTELATGSRPVSTPLTLATAKVTSWTPGVPGSSTTWRLMFMVSSSMRWALGSNGSRSVTFSIRMRVTSICIPETTGLSGAGTTLSRCSSGTPASANRPLTFGAARCTVLITPPSLICTVFGLTTASAMPSSGTRDAREAACGALSVMSSCARASSTVAAVVHSCSLSWPSSETSRGRLRLSTMVPASETLSSAAGSRSSRSPTSKPFSSTMSSTRDFMVVTVIGVPSTDSVTVLWAATANPPANVRATSVAATTIRSIGERA